MSKAGGESETIERTPVRRHSITVGDLVRQQARCLGDRPVVAEGALTITYRELDARTDQLAGALWAAGVRPGLPVPWLGRNSHRFLLLFVAAAKIGAIAVPLNWRLPDSSLVAIVQELEPVVGFSEGGELAPLCAEVRELTPQSMRWIQHDAEGAFEDFAASGSGFPDVDVDSDQPVLIIYTGSASGDVHGSMLSHGNLFAQGMAMMVIRGIEPRTVYLACSPLFHIWTAKDLVPVLMAGARLVFVPGLDPDDLSDVIEAHGVTLANLLEPTIEKMVEAVSRRPRDLSTLCSSGPNPAWRKLVSEDTSLWGCYGAGYGQTEVTGVICYAGLAGTEVSGIAGRPGAFGRVRIEDEDGTEVPDGQIGEIVVAGPVVHLGYWKRPALNAERWRNDFWRTNDLGFRDADGLIRFVGAKTRLIKSGGENIYANEVEIHLQSHPAVSQVAVIGVPDEVWGQSVLAVVVAEAGYEVTEEVLIEHCRNGLAPYKKPRLIAFVGAIPSNERGRDYDALDRAFGGGGYPGSTSYVGHPG